METELWAASVERDLTAAENETMLSLLPPERQSRLLRVKDHSRRKEALCAYTLLRRMLWQRMGWTDLPEITLSNYGKPWFPDYPDVQFNISHTSGAVLVGLSDKPIGVDIEKLRPVSERVMRRVAGVQTSEQFFLCWVSLEAKGKRSGRGVGTMLEAGRNLRDERLCRHLKIFPGYVACAAVSPGCSIPEVKMFTI